MKRKTLFNGNGSLFQEETKKMRIHILIQNGIKQKLMALKEKNSPLELKTSTLISQ